MKSIIEDLWNGNIAPSKYCGANDPELAKVLLLMERHKTVLFRELEREHREVFEKYNDSIEEYIYMISLHAFRDGFRLAGSLVAEAFPDNS